MKERNVTMKKRQHLTGEKVKIDYAMLTLLAAKKGLSPSELSHMIGQTHSWLSARHHDYDDVIPVAAAVLIEEKAGIRKEDFLAKTEPAEESPCQKTLFDHDSFGGNNWISLPEDVACMLTAFCDLIDMDPQEYLAKLVTRDIKEKKRRLRGSFDEAM